MLAERSRRVGNRKGDMNPLLQDADATQGAYVFDDNGRAKPSQDENRSTDSEKLLVPHHVKVGFFLAGLFNNMSYCIILAGAKEVSSFSFPLIHFMFEIGHY